MNIKIVYIETYYVGKITISSDTHCSTFLENNGNLTNLYSIYFTTSNDITCKAVNFHYNSNHTCTADSVHVNDSHVNYDTFIND